MKMMNSNSLAVVGMIIIAIGALIVVSLPTTNSEVRIAVVGIASGVVGALSQFITPHKQTPPPKDPVTENE